MYQMSRGIIHNFSRLVCSNACQTCSFAAHIFLYTICDKNNDIDSSNNKIITLQTNHTNNAAGKSSRVESPQNCSKQVVFEKFVTVQE